MLIRQFLIELFKILFPGEPKLVKVNSTCTILSSTKFWFFSSLSVLCTFCFLLHLLGVQYDVD